MWLSNIVLVEKANRQWQVCVDFTNFNKACPKDYFLLPRINQLMDATMAHQLLNFMDAYSGYNQIKMHLSIRSILPSCPIYGFIATKWCPSTLRM